MDQFLPSHLSELVTERVTTVIEPTGGYTVLQRDLRIGGAGDTVADAIADPLKHARWFVEDYQDWNGVTHEPSLENYVRELATVNNDAELYNLLARGPQ